MRITRLPCMHEAYLTAVLAARSTAALVAAIALSVHVFRCPARRCDWEGHVHVPVWTTPAVLALVFVLCLWGCHNQRHKLRKKGHHRIPVHK